MAQELSGISITGRKNFRNFGRLPGSGGLGTDSGGVAGTARTEMTTRDGMDAAGAGVIVPGIVDDGPFCTLFRAHRAIEYNRPRGKRPRSG
jgi:hypothetical protein